MSYGGPARTADHRAAPDMPDGAWPGETAPGRLRWPLIAAGAGTVLLLIVVLGVVASLRSGSSRNADPNPNPSATRTLGLTNQGAPTNVKLTDKGTSVTVTWTDPTDGTAPFAVLGSPEGTQLLLLGSADPGTTSYTQNGVNAAVDYCYVVAAFYSASGENIAAKSPQVCTHRLG
jgi:hypothetical protein